MRWFLKAADPKAHPDTSMEIRLAKADAEIAIAGIFMDGNGGAPEGSRRALEQAIEWCRKAVDHGHPKAKTMLAVLENLTVHINASSGESVGDLVVLA
jgi:TPR repeat protein